MISVGSRDARKGLGLLGFGVEGGEMEETELEEGEAAFHNHNHGDDDDDTTIDPDVALSYIDEKLHDVLGHFQKDFEGGVSAENLGAKFGGYGSFLPTYQRSPAWTHPRSPPRVQNHNASISPSNLHVEGGRQNSVISSSASQLARAGPSSANAQSVPARGPPANYTAKREVCSSSTRRDEDFSSKGEPVKKSGNASDQKTLKVRIKMGSDNLSTRKNAEIYSGLGLDVSPSSSLECSPIDSEGFSREPLDSPYESPTSILQIMTSSPVHGSLLLSPLPYELTCLIEKEKLRGDRSGPVHKWSQVSTVAVVNGSDSDKVDQKVSGEKKLKSLGSNLVSAESMNSNGDDAGNNIHVTKKETDMDTLAFEELVSNALRLPLLSNSNCDVVDLGKGNIKADNILTVGNNGGMLPKEESLEPVFTRENGQVEKPSRRDTSVKKWESKKVNSDDEDSVYSVKGGKEADVSVKAESSVSKNQKSLNSEPIDHVNPKAAEKATSLDNDRLKLAPVKDTSSSGGKKKSKGSQSHSAQHAEVPKDSLKKESSVSKSRKSTYVNGYMSKSDVEDSKKDSGITKETYQEFFGDLELEQDDSEMALEEKPFGDTPKESAILEKSTLEVNGGSKARLDGKRNQKPSMPVYPRPGSHMAPVNCNGPVSDAAATVTPVVKEDWVCCDKCQKWRLLPLGTNPDSLPENWLCSMLNWLPGMNRCSISEEETTKALIALYHVPGPENLSSVGGILPGVFAADPLQFDQKYQHLGSRGLPAGGKKKHGSKDAANETKQDCLAQPSNPIKKNLQTPVKGMGLNGVYQSPTMNGVDLQDSSQSKSLVVDKHRQKQKEKIKEKYMDGGEHSKIRNKRDTDQDGSRVGKKIKTDGVHYADEDWASDHGGAHLKGRSSSSGLSINGSGRDHRKSKERSDDSKSDSKGSVRNQEHQNQITPNDGSLHMRKSDERDVAKKRKLNDYQDSQIYNKSLPSVGRDLQESSETNRRKEKKARVSKSRGEETCASKDSGGADKRGRSIKDEQVGSLDAIDSSKRDTGSVAATSSSSKVSGSHKTKANPLEVKGSPVESVSSSPLRTLNPDKFTVTKGSDGEDDRGSYQTVRKDETLPGANGSLGSSVLDLQEKDLSQALGNKVKVEVLPSPEFATCHVTDGDADTLGQGGQYGSRPETLDEDHNEERWNDKQGHSNGSRPRKPGKASSSRSKDKSRSSRSEYDKVNLKVPDSSNEYEENSKAGRNKLQDKFSLSTDKVEKGSVSKKESSGKLSSENVKRDSYSKYGRTDGSDVKKEAISGQDAKQNLAMDRDGEKSLKRAVSDKTDRVDVPGRGKSHSLPPSGRGQNETARLPQAVPVSHKENGGISSSVDASEGNDLLRAPKQNRKAENQSGNQPSNTRHSTPNRHKGRDHDAPSPLRRDSASQAATNALKEATDLKHLADRLKNSGSHLESTGYYFQAVLKFLLGASLLESCNSESTKHVDMYSSTANLCEYCAREYEKSRDMAGAALAYKCTEVAYLKVVYSSHSLASKDRHELQTAMQITPTGESPSSSASDLDNLNNPATVDKVALAKGVSPPQIAGNHVIAARNRPNFTRLLTFARNVNLAMEASRKSRIAFAAVISKPEGKEAISSVKKALDFNFQDVDGLLRLVRLAMETISR